MGEAFKKAIIPSCIFALMGIPFALVGGVLFFLLGLIVFTLGFYLYDKVVPKKQLSEYDTIEMCREYLDKTTDMINEYGTKKYGALTLKSTIFDDKNHALIFRFDFDSTQGDIDIVSEYRRLIEASFTQDDLEKNKIYIACVYLGADYIAKIRDHKKGEVYDVVFSLNEMKTAISKWHTFGTEYSWI